MHLGEKQDVKANIGKSDFKLRKILFIYISAVFLKWSDVFKNEATAF